VPETAPYIDIRRAKTLYDTDCIVAVLHKDRGDEKTMTGEYTISARTADRNAQAAIICKVMSFVKMQPDAEVIKTYGNPPNIFLMKATSSTIETLVKLFGNDINIESDESGNFGLFNISSI
jgi:hypothetical protein